MTRYPNKPFRLVAIAATGVCLLLVLTVSNAYAGDKAPVYKPGHKVVNCDKGQSVAKALRHARPGSKIIVRGICNERIRITKPGIRLVGKGVAGFDPGDGPTDPFEFNPVIDVKDAPKVLLKNLEVRNSGAEGVIIRGQSTVRMVAMNVHSNGNVGVLVDHARLNVVDGSYDGNQGGIDAINNASVVLKGSVSLQNNIIFGIAASNGSSLELRGAALTASNNQLAGVIVEGGNLAVFNFGVSQGSQVLADNNGLCGFVLVGGGFVDVVAPPPLHFSGINLFRAQNNGGCGILMGTGSKLESVFGAATFQLEGNGVGMQVGGNSDVSINGGLNIANNFGPGLVADGAGVITLAPLDPSPPPALPTIIDGNGGPNVILNFGSRATFATNVTVGSIVCDGTALSRGSAVCP